MGGKNKSSNRTGNHSPGTSSTDRDRTTHLSSNRKTKPKPIDDCNQNGNGNGLGNGKLTANKDKKDSIHIRNGEVNKASKVKKVNKASNGSNNLNIGQKVQQKRRLSAQRECKEMDENDNDITNDNDMDEL